MLQFTEGGVLEKKTIYQCHIGKWFISKSPPLVNCNIQKYSPKGKNHTYESGKYTKVALATLVNCENFAMGYDRVR